MDQQTTTEQHRPANLIGPDMPADNGLGSLGLLMQLGGSIFMGLMIWMSIVMMLTASRMPGGTILMLVAILGVVRSAMHRSAGTALLYGGNLRPFSPSLKYAAFAIGHSIMTYWAMGAKLHMTSNARMPLLLMMLAWPITLLIVIHLPRFQRFADNVPVPEDRGYEGAGVYMVLFGIIGALSTGILALMMLTKGSRILQSMEGLLIFACIVGLCVRSIMHARAGLVAVQDHGQDRVSDSAMNYTNWGIMTSVITGGVLLLVMMMNRGDGQVIALIAVMVHMLLAWPLILRRFFAERDFGVTLDPSQAQNEYRSPDMGMTALGWLLLATSVIGIAGALSSSGDPRALRGLGGGFMPTDLARQFGRSTMWSLVSSGLALWAAIELIGMTSRWKLSVYVYGAVATAITLYLSLPLLENMSEFLRYASRRGPGSLMIFGQVAIALVVPVGGMLLANRHGKTATRARIRRPEGDDDGPR